MANDEDDGFITLPPGIFDSGTFKTPVRPTRPRAEKPEVVFVPTVPGAPPPLPAPLDEEPAGADASDASDAPATPPSAALPEPDAAAAPEHDEAASPDGHAQRPVSLDTRRDIDDDFTPPTPRGAHAAHPVAEWMLELADGTTVALTSHVLIGRNPTHLDGWSTATLVALDDTTKSVSKTHAALEIDDSGLWVHDLASTNGVWVAVGDDATEVATGRRVAVPDGAEIELGEYVMRAVRR